MRYICDENFPTDAVARLRAKGHDVTWLSEFAPGLDDSRILQLAITEERILLTFDRDFGELAMRHRPTGNTGIVYFRIPGRPPETLAHRIVAALEQGENWAGRISVVEPGRVREWR